MITKKHVDALLTGLVLGDIDGNKDDFYSHCLALYRVGYKLDGGQINLIHQVLQSKDIERRCYRYIFGMLENANNNDGAAYIINAFALSGDGLNSDSERPYKVAQHAVSSLISLAEKGGINAIEHLLDMLDNGYIYFNHKANVQKLFGIIPDELTAKILKDIENPDRSISVSAINALSRLAWNNCEVFDLFKARLGQDDITSDNYYLFVSRFMSSVDSSPCADVVEWAVNDAKLGLKQTNDEGEIPLATEVLIGHMSMYSPDMRELLTENTDKLERAAYYLTMGIRNTAEGDLCFDEEPVKELVSFLLSKNKHKEWIAILNMCSELGWVELLLDAYLKGDKAEYIIKAIARVEVMEGEKWIEDLREIA